MLAPEREEKGTRRPRKSKTRSYWDRAHWLLTQSPSLHPIAAGCGPGPFAASFPTASPDGHPDTQASM